MGETPDNHTFSNITGTGPRLLEGYSRRFLYDFLADLTMRFDPHKPPLAREGTYSGCEAARLSRLCPPYCTREIEAQQESMKITFLSNLSRRLDSRIGLCPTDSPTP